MNWKVIVVAGLLLTTGFSSSPSHAGVESYIAKETAEAIVKRFGREAVEEGVEGLTRKIGRYAAKWGDDALVAFRRVGPKVARFADDAGEHAPVALRMLAKHGDDAIRLVARPKQLGLVARLGDDAAECLLKHGDVAEPLLHSFGAPAAKALNSISTQNGRRVSMMLADGQLAKIGRSDELLGVIDRCGDAGANWVWKNKGALSLGAGLTTFLSSPETFINGGTELTSIVADAAIKPVVIAAAEFTPWFAVASVIGLFAGLIGGWQILVWRCRPRQKFQIPGVPAKSAGDPNLN